MLNNLREGDTFNIVAYDSTVESFGPNSRSSTTRPARPRRGFVEGLMPGGGTNIDGAISAGLRSSKIPAGRPSSSF